MTMLVDVNCRFYMLEEGAPVTKDSDIAFSGAPAEPAAMAIRREMKQGMDIAYWLTWRHPMFPDDELISRLDEDFTLGQLENAFGEDLRTTPPVIHIDNGGQGNKIGRGAGDFMSLVNLLRAAFEVAGIGGVLTATYRKAMEVKHGNIRRLARNWNETGLASTDLQLFVLSNSQ